MKNLQIGSGFEALPLNSFLHPN